MTACRYSLRGRVYRAATPGTRPPAPHERRASTPTSPSRRAAGQPAHNQHIPERRTHPACVGRKDVLMSPPAPQAHGGVRPAGATVEALA